MRLVFALVALSLAGCSKEEPAATQQDPQPGSKPAPQNDPQPAAKAADPAPQAAKPAPAGLVGNPAPDFTLPDLDGNQVSLSAHRGKTVVLEWFNPQCPYVKKAHTRGSLVDAAKRHQDAGVVWLAINSGGTGKQGHDPQVNRDAAAEWKLTHPILRDESGATGKAYGATNTPNMFVIAPDGTVVYAGAIDNSPDGEGESPEGGTLVNHVDAALEDLAAGRPVRTPSTKPYGCGVKYAS